MATQRTISFRIPTKKVATLDALAETMDRDRSYLLNEAVQHYLDLNEYHIKLIEKGLRAAEKGDFVPDAEMKKLLAQMGQAPSHQARSRQAPLRQARSRRTR